MIKGKSEASELDMMPKSSKEVVSDTDSHNGNFRELQGTPLEEVQDVPAPLQVEYTKVVESELLPVDYPSFDSPPMDNVSRTTASTFLLRTY